MDSKKYIGMDVHKESISIAVRNAVGKLVMECVIETKASMVLQFIDGLRGDLQVTFEEGTWAAWLYDPLKPPTVKLGKMRLGHFVSRLTLGPLGQPEKAIGHEPPIELWLAPDDRSALRSQN